MTGWEAILIARIWFGWASRANADAYEHLLRNEILPGIRSRSIAGLRSIELLRRSGADEEEFVTIMRFDSLDAVKAFAGESYETAVVPPRARSLLSRFEATSRHYHVIENRGA
ncbi:MAG: antibiotic biosynthesis monooxygenase [Xanthobacteraceae bacterium]